MKWLREAWIEFMKILRNNELRTEEKLQCLFIFYLITIVAGLIIIWSTFGFLRKLVELVTGIFGS